MRSPVRRPLRLLVGSLLGLTLVAGCGSNVRPPEPSASSSTPTPSDPGSASTGAPTTAPPTAPPTTAPPTTAPPTVGTRSAPQRRRFHRGPGQTYRFENSPRGLAYARSKGYVWIDIDSNYARGRVNGRWGPVVLIATHWDKIDTEGFDPQGRYPEGTRWRDLTWPQVRALRTADRPPYRILTMEEMVRRTAAAGFTGMEWEVKTGPAFEDPRTYARVLQVAREVGLTIEVKTLYGLGGVEASYRRLRAAKLAGAFTMLIKPPGRPVRLPAAQERWIDVVRGPWRRAG